MRHGWYRSTASTIATQPFDFVWQSKDKDGCRWPRTSQIVVATGETVSHENDEAGDDKRNGSETGPTETGSVIGAAWSEAAAAAATTALSPHGEGRDETAPVVPEGSLWEADDG